MADAFYCAVADHSGCVVDTPPVLVHKTDDGRNPPDPGGQSSEFGQIIFYELRLQKEIFGGIARHCKFRKGDEIGTLVPSLFNVLEHFAAVAPEVSYRAIYLG